MADFDAIYEDNSVDAPVGPAAAAGASASASASFSVPEATSLFPPAATLVPDPIVVRGAGNITV